MESESEDDVKTIQNVQIIEKNLLLDLPIEIFLQICTYLSSRVIIKNLSLVCKHLNNIIKNDSSWKHRIFNRWPKQYPPVSCSDIDWKRASLEREDQYQLWSDFDSKMIKHSLHAHYADVNCVLLINEGSTCISGGRDHSLAVWDMKQLYNDNVINKDADTNNSSSYIKSKCCTKFIREAHNGWVWNLDSCESLVSSGSWDKTISIRDLNTDFQVTQTLKLNSAVLCQSFKKNRIISGSFDKKIYIFDLRESDKPSTALMFHKGPIISLQTDANLVISASEDKRIFITDLRMPNSYLKKIELNYVPTSTFYKYNHLWVGETVLHLYDSSNQLFEHVETVDLNHKSKITCIQYTHGSLITCSKDRSLKLSEPSSQPSVIKTLTYGNELGAFKFLNNNLVVANQASIDVFIPKETQYLY